MAETTSIPPKKKPLDGVVVLDFSRMLAGPYCSAILADMGAEIIKVEPPPGDDQRHIGAMRDGLSISFEVLNRNKRSIRLDLRDERGRDIARALAEKADVVLENYRPGVTRKLGIDYETIRQSNPGIVYCSISGFGQKGPMADAPSYDVVAQALSGLMSVTGHPDGEPTLVGDSIGDIIAGLYAALAVAVALFDRARTSTGTYMDVAMFDGLFSLLPTALAKWQKDGKAPGRAGNHHPLTAPFGAFSAGDGLFMVAVANEKLFRGLCAAIGKPELADDPAFSSDSARFANRGELERIISGWAAEMTAVEAVAILSAAGLPASVVWDVEQAATSDQVEERGLLHAVPHPVLGSLLLPEQPIHFAGIARGATRPAPQCGEDGRALLSTFLKLSEHEIDQLSEAGVI